MSGSNEQQQAPPNLNDAIQALIRQQIAAASGQPQVQLPAMPTPQAQTQYSNDPEKGPDLLARIGLAIGGGSLPGAPAELRQQMGKQALLNFGIGLLGAGKFSTPGQVLAGGLRGAQAGLLGSEAAQAGQQEYALNAQAKLAELASAQQKNRTEALTALVPLLQLQGRMGLPPLFGPGSQAGQPGGGGSGGEALTGEWEHDAPIIAKRESGGDPTALNYVAKADPTAYDRGATASGKYQIVNSTWREGMQLAGLDPAKYPTARSAPEAVQDQVAKAIYGKYGTAPWDASKFGANWVQQPNGTYQLVKGAPPPASGPGSVGPYKVAGPPVAPPAQPAGGPPAPAGGGGTTAALPLPPEPPPGAVPSPAVGPSLAPTTSTDPETGLPVLTPAGTPAVLPPPPPGQVTTPGGQLSPAPATGPVTPPSPGPPAPAPQQPPAAPAQPPAQPPAPTPAPASRAHDYSVPDTELNAEEYQDRRFRPATPEEVRRYAPGPTGELAAAAAEQVQRARDNVRAQQTQLDQMRRGQLPGDAVAQAGKVTDAEKELDAAENTYNSQVQKLAEAGAKNLLERDNTERKRVSDDYKSLVIEPRNKAAELKQQAETQLKLEEFKAEQQRLTNEAAVRNKVNQDTLDQARKDQVDARNLAASVEGFQTMTANMGQPGWLQTTKNPFGQGETIAEKLGQMGVPVDNTGGFQAMQAGINEMIKSLRAGMPMGSLSDRDLDFIRRMGPTEWMDPDTRMAVTSYIRQAARAKQQFSYEIQKHLSKPGANAADAIEAADAKVKSFVPEVPFSSREWVDRTPEGIAKRMQWLQDHPLPPGTLYHLNDGAVMISKRPAAQQPNRPQQGPTVGYGNQ